LRPPVATVADAFAAIPALVQVIEIPGGDRWHPHAHHHAVEHATEMVLLFVVFVVVFGNVFVRIYRQDGTEVRLSY
jgi:hypothetical protein